MENGLWSWDSVSWFSDYTEIPLSCCVAWDVRPLELGGYDLRELLVRTSGMMITLQKGKNDFCMGRNLDENHNPNARFYYHSIWSAAFLKMSQRWNVLISFLVVLCGQTLLDCLPYSHLLITKEWRADLIKEACSLHYFNWRAFSPGTLWDAVLLHWAQIQQVNMHAFPIDYNLFITFHLIA